MAEDLGHIKIDFGSLNTGPDATRTQGAAAGAGRAGGGGGGSLYGTAGAMIGAAYAGPAGAQIGAVAGEKIGEIVEWVQNAGKKIIETVQKAYAFIVSTAQQFRERGKFSPEVMFENVANKVQAIQQQVREAQVLGPLYAMVLRWYRELMRLLEPWKLLLQSLLALLAGSILAVFTAVLTQLNKALPAILRGIISILDVLQQVTNFTARNASSVASGAISAVSPALGYLGVLGNLLGITTPQSMMKNTIIGVANSLGQIIPVLQSSLQGILQIATNTAPPISGNVWAESQLREIAAISPLYRTTGQPGYATPGGQAPFFRPPGSTYP
jgi:hypothetical protein